MWESPPRGPCGFHISLGYQASPRSMYASAASFVLATAPFPPPALLGPRRCPLACGEDHLYGDLVVQGGILALSPALLSCLNGLGASIVVLLRILHEVEGGTHVPPPALLGFLDCLGHLPGKLEVVGGTED